MASELRVNSSTNRSGLGTITYTDSGPIVSGVGTFANGLTVDGTQTTVKSLKLTGDSYNVNWFKTTHKLRFNDNAKATFGTADDLSVYHDGNNSYIQDAGTGQLRFLSNDYVLYNAAGNENLLRITENTGVSLYDGANTVRLATTSTGIDVTGSVVADDLIITGPSVVADLKSTNNNYVLGLAGNNASDKVYLGTTSGNDFIIANTSSVTERLRITSTGTVGINETTPEAKLEVRSSDATYALKITNDQNTSGSYNGLSIAGYDENTGSYPFIIVGNSITHETGGNPKFCVRADGNVGINKSSPDHKLDVASSEDSYGIRTTCGIRIDANTSSSKLISTAAGMFYVTASLTSSDDTWFTVAKIQYATGSFTCVVGDASSRNVMTGHFMATIPAYGVSFLSKKESSGAWNTGSSDIQMVNDGSHMAIQVKHNSYYNDSNSAGCYLMLVQCY